VPFYFINLLPTSLLYISILLQTHTNTHAHTHTHFPFNRGGRRGTLKDAQTRPMKRPVSTICKLISAKGRTSLFCGSALPVECSHTHTHTRIHAHTHTHTHAHAHTQTHTHTHTHTHLRPHTSLPFSLLALHTHMHPHMHPHTHTHTQTSRFEWVGRRCSVQHSYPVFQL
jgi:hypothetical protein